MSADYSDFFAIRDEIMEQLQINDMNIGDKAIKLPAIKQFWIAKMIQYRIEIKKLEDQKSEGLVKFIEKMNNESEVQLSKESVTKMYNGSKQVKALNERIQVLNLIVEYLNDVKYALGRATDDIKNKIELDKLERL